MSSWRVSPEDINPISFLAGFWISCSYNTLKQAHSQSSLFSLLYYNARCLLSKIDCLHALLLIHKPDTICIVETCLCPDITATVISLPGYSAVRLDIDMVVALSYLWLTSETWKSCNRALLTSFLLVSGQCAQFQLAALYRLPSSPISYFDNL